MSLGAATRRYFDALDALGLNPEAYRGPAPSGRLGEAAAEHEIPPPYVEFLGVTDGCGILFGLDEIGSDEHEELAEALTFDDDLPEALQQAFVLGGALEDDLIPLMLPDGAVIEYEDYETESFPSLSAWLEHAAEHLEAHKREVDALAEEVR